MAVTIYSVLFVVFIAKSKLKPCKEFIIKKGNIMKFHIKVNDEQLCEITGNDLFSVEDIYAMDVTEQEADFIRSAMENLERMGYKRDIYKSEKINIEVWK